MECLLHINLACLLHIFIGRMSYRDFSTHFQRVEICNIQPDSTGSDDIKRWEYTLKDGSWTRNVNAGGCRNNPGGMAIG